MNRVKLMWLIMIASSITGVAQYVLLGVTGTNHDPATFAWWFWVTEFVLWGIRAIVESVCVGYIFMTIANKWQDRLVLTFFEAVILLEIATTIGTMTAAVGSSNSIYQMIATYGGEYYFLWAFAMGAYAPLMMAGAGVAYRIQPIAAGQQIVSAADIKTIEGLQQRNEELQQDIKLLRQSNEELQLDNQRSQVWQRLSTAAKAKIVVDDLPNQNGNGAAMEQAARQELGSQAVSRAKAK